MGRGIGAGGGIDIAQARRQPAQRQTRLDVSEEEAPTFHTRCHVSPFCLTAPSALRPPMQMLQLVNNLAGFSANPWGGAIRQGTGGCPASRPGCSSRAPLSRGDVNAPPPPLRPARSARNRAPAARPAR